MKVLQVVIECENAAFDDPMELPRILRRLAMDLEDGVGSHDWSTVLRDRNGNTVGHATYEVT